MKSGNMLKLRPSSLNTLYASYCKSQSHHYSMMNGKISMTSGHRMYSSIHEASFFTVMDDSYDASKYGYRVFVPHTPTRTPVVTSSLTTSPTTTKATSHRHSSSAAHYDNNYNHHHHNMQHGYHNDNSTTRTILDEYAHCMRTIDPSSLDILSSPEVLAILESQRDWDASKKETTLYNTLANDNSNEDPYLSDCEEMQDSWEENLELKVEPPIAVCLDKLPSIDEKKM